MNCDGDAVAVITAELQSWVDRDSEAPERIEVIWRGLDVIAGMPEPDRAIRIQIREMLTLMERLGCVMDLADATTPARLQACLTATSTWPGRGPLRAVLPLVRYFLASTVTVTFWHFRSSDSVFNEPPEPRKAGVMDGAWLSLLEYFTGLVLRLGIAEEFLPVLSAWAPSLPRSVMTDVLDVALRAHQASSYAPDTHTVSLLAECANVYDGDRFLSKLLAEPFLWHCGPVIVHQARTLEQMNRLAGYVHTMSRVPRLKCGALTLSPLYRRLKLTPRAACVSVPEESLLECPRGRRFWRLFFRRRAAEICVGLQDLNLPALQTNAIIDAAMPNDHPMHYIWRIVTTVKHFK